MLNIERKLDKVLNILYDENLLHWKEIPSTDFISQFASKKHNIKWTDAEIGLILKILENGKYIILNKTTIDSGKMPSYSLTPKGVIMKRDGGFVRQKIKSILTNYIILWASIFTIIVTILSFIDYIDNNEDSNVNNDKQLNCPTHTTIPKMVDDTTFNKTIKPAISDTTNNISKHNK